MANPLKTDDAVIGTVARVIAGAPLAFFGVMHLVGPMPMQPLMEAAGLPMPEIAAVIAPLAQLAAGLLLLAGALTRPAALLAIGTMLGAILTHLRIPNDQWPETNGGPQEPLFLMALAVIIIAAAALAVWRGAGRWSIDGKLA